MRRLSPVLLLLLGSLVSATPGCGDGDESIDNKPSNGDKKDSGAEDTDDETASNASTSANNTAATNTASTTPSSVGTSASTESTGATSNNPAPPGTAIGIECEDDGDCLSPLTCVRENDSFRGAIPGSGVCTMPCTADATCLAVDDLGICVAIGSPTTEDIANAPDGELPNGAAGYCMQACFYGDPVEKCGELTTFTCVPTAEQITSSVLLGICMPLCFNDSNCQDGEHCDTGSGLCLPENGEGKPVGSDCDPSSEDPECSEGYCFATSETAGFCTTNCSSRPETLICGGGDPGPDAQSRCYPNLDVYVGTEGQVLSTYGDLGQCWPLCDTKDDCPAGLECDTADVDAEMLTGRKGLCLPGEEDVETAGDAGTQDSGTTDVVSTSTTVDGG